MNGNDSADFVHIVSRSYINIMESIICFISENRFNKNSNTVIQLEICLIAYSISL